MSRLPDISGKELLKILEKEGFKRVRQRGSHVSVQKITPHKTYKFVVPMHKTVAKGTLMSVLRFADISRDEFLELYKRK